MRKIKRLPTPQKFLGDKSVLIILVIIPLVSSTTFIFTIVIFVISAIAIVAILPIAPILPSYLEVMFRGRSQPLRIKTFVFENYRLKK
jgi:hypothetical protein